MINNIKIVSLTRVSLKPKWKFFLNNWIDVQFHPAEAGWPSSRWSTPAWECTSDSNGQTEPWVEHCKTLKNGKQKLGSKLNGHLTNYSSFLFYWPGTFGLSISQAKHSGGRLPEMQLVIRGRVGGQIFAVGRESCRNDRASVRSQQLNLTCAKLIHCQGAWNEKTIKSDPKLRQKIVRIIHNRNYSYVTHGVRFTDKLILVELAYGSSVSDLSQFSKQPRMPQKIAIASKVV